MIFRALYVSAWATLLAFSVIAPNTLKELCIAALSVLALTYLFQYGLGLFKERYFLYLGISVPVTLFYISVGAARGAPLLASQQIAITYIVTPFLWGIVLLGALKRHGLTTISRVLVLCLVLAVLTQAYYVYAFLNIGPEAVGFLVEEPNVDLTHDAVASTMYVYGSMILLTGGLLSSSRLINSRFLYYLLVTISLVSAFTAGRSALVLSVMIGLFVNLMSSKRSAVRNFLSIATISLILFVLFAVFQDYLSLDLSYNFYRMADKLLSGGGEGRNEQFFALLDGIANAYGLGAGHGIGVSYSVGGRFPWRYELVWLATIFRVGFLGAAVYSLPFLVALLSGGRRLIGGQLNHYELFIFGGLVCSYIATNTNPYIEAFVFQWMFVLPLLYFTSSRQFLPVRDKR